MSSYLERLAARTTGAGLPSAVFHPTRSSHNYRSRGEHGFFESTEETGVDLRDRQDRSSRADFDDRREATNQPVYGVPGIQVPSESATASPGGPESYWISSPSTGHAASHFLEASFHGSEPIDDCVPGREKGGIAARPIPAFETHERNRRSTIATESPQVFLDAVVGPETDMDRRQYSHRTKPEKESQHGQSINPSDVRPPDEGLRQSEEPRPRRFFRGEGETADLIPARKPEVQSGSAEPSTLPPDFHLLPRRTTPPSATGNPPEQPKIVIGRLSVEVVQAQPSAKQSFQTITPPRPSRAPSGHGVGPRTKLHFGLGQV